MQDGIFYEYCLAFNRRQLTGRSRAKALGLRPQGVRRRASVELIRVEIMISGNVQAPLHERRMEKRYRSFEK